MVKSECNTERGFKNQLYIELGMALYFLPIFEHYEAFLLVFTTNTDVICFFKLLRYSNLCRVLPENGVPYSDILISLVVFTLDQNTNKKIMSFTVARDGNQRSWFYRIRPSVVQGSFSPIENGKLRWSPCAFNS